MTFWRKNEEWGFSLFRKMFERILKWVRNKENKACLNLLSELWVEWILHSNFKIFSLTTKRSWVQTPTVKTTFHALFVSIKVGIYNISETLSCALNCAVILQIEERLA